MNEHLAAFVGYLTDKEKSKSTIESYTRYVKKFLKYVDGNEITKELVCLLYTSPSPRDSTSSRMPSSA